MDRGMDRASSSAEHFTRDARWTPPDQYGIVESQVYRSAFLTPASFDFINLLNLRTVVNLSQEVPVRAVLAFFQENRITLENVGLQVWTRLEYVPITLELVKETLQHVLDVSRHPLLLMSSSGTHQVGVVIGCLRQQQSWNLASILDEYRSFASPSARLNCEQFIELWDTAAAHVHTAPCSTRPHASHGSMLHNRPCFTRPATRGLAPRRGAAHQPRHPSLAYAPTLSYLQDQLTLPMRPPAWWGAAELLQHADLEAWAELREQEMREQEMREEMRRDQPGAASQARAGKASPGLRRPASEGTQLCEVGHHREPEPRSGPGIEYFLVSGPLASPDTTTSMVDEDED